MSGRQSHGWVVPNASGTKARCGGPALCRVCQDERARLEITREAWLVAMEKVADEYFAGNVGAAFDVGRAEAERDAARAEANAEMARADANFHEVTKLHQENAALLGLLRLAREDLVDFVGADPEVLAKIDAALADGMLEVEAEKR